MLLILAGVTIVLVVGDNGILNQAVNAADETNRSNAQTELEMAVSAVVTDWSGARYIDGNKQTLEEYLTKDRVEANMNLDEYKLTAFILNTDEGATVNYRGKDYKFTVEITASGNSAKVTYDGLSDGTVVTPPVEGENFAEVVTATNYGDYVDYPIDLNGDGDTTNDWRIFYNNGENIFIIAGDYVKSDSIFLDLEAAEMYRVANDPSYSKDIYLLNWYDSVNSEITLTSYQGNENINETISSMFMYEKYLTKNPTSTNANAKATASMLSQTAWNGFKDENYAQYAVGGPTLEMLVTSYNAKGYDDLYTNVNDIGYYVGNTEGTTSDSYDVKDDTNNGSDDTLYFPHKDRVGNCFGYWLASPSARYANGVMGVYFSDINGSAYYGSSYFSMRPVVSLKSNVTATQNGSVWKLSI